jgi:predicted dehydrogenase
MNLRNLLTIVLTFSLIGPAMGQNADPSPLRVGVVGLVHSHVHWILGRPDRGDIEIVGIAEPNRELARRYAGQHSFSMDLVYDSLEEMLEAARPDAVTAFNTIYGHLEVVEQCAPRGIHVMVEKPLAVSLDHARKMAKLARQHGIHLLTNYETTWYGSNHEAYDLVREGRIGPLRKVVVHDGHPGPKEIGVNEEFLEWLTDPRYNGAGALTDFGCYGANLITWLMQGQRPETVTAVTQQIKPSVYPEVDDEATIILTYPQTQGIIQASWNWPYNRKDIEIYGKTGYIINKDRRQMEILYEEEKGSFNREASPRKEPLDDPFAYLAAVVRKKVIPQPSDLSALENNLIVMEILDAALRSAKSGKTIHLKK